MFIIIVIIIVVIIVVTTTIVIIVTLGNTMFMGSITIIVDIISADNHYYCNHFHHCHRRHHRHHFHLGEDHVHGVAPALRVAKGHCKHVRAVGHEGVAKEPGSVENDDVDKT